VNDISQTPVNAYFDQKVQGQTMFVLPGYHYVLRDHQISISTLLGSCVSACLRDKEMNLGGLNHFLLPENRSNSDESQSARYGVQAMEVLINDLLKQGAKKTNLVAKIFGGANIIATTSPNSVGMQNANFVKDFLQAEGIPVLAEDLGGTRARRIYFYPESGRVSVLLVGTSDVETVRAREAEMRQKASSSANSGTVELF